MSRNICCLSGLLLLLLSAFGVSDAVDPDCDFRQKLEPGRSYSIANPNYPASYSLPRSCRWHAISDTRVRLSCKEFKIAASPNCESDALNVYTDPVSGPHKYCGTGDFSKDSDGKEMIITLTTGPNASGGTFRCLLEAIEEDECRCGWKKPTKIVGGIETGVNEYPMMAAILNIIAKQVYCGATIISNKHVLTAAHCLTVLSANNLGILVGDHDLTTGQETNATKLYRVANFVIHPSYVNNKKDYDIAVVTIAGTITFTNEVGPACLPFQHYLDSFGGSYVDVLGWGTEEFAGAPSNTLQKVRLSVPNFLACKKFFSNLEYRQICTYAEGKDACQFDSGGPVLWQNPTTRRLVHVGIISFGSFCATDEPAVNTRVGSFIDWIVQVTPGVQYCQAE